MDVYRLLNTPSTAIATRAGSTIPVRHDPGDYIRSGMAAAMERLRSVLSPFDRNSTEAFEHELARIFLDEANDTDSGELCMTPDHFCLMFLGGAVHRPFDPPQVYSVTSITVIFWSLEI